jgi:hypothetical protein
LNRGLKAFRGMNTHRCPLPLLNSFHFWVCQAVGTSSSCLLALLPPLSVTADFEHEASIPAGRPEATSCTWRGLSAGDQGVSHITKAEVKERREIAVVELDTPHEMEKIKTENDLVKWL